MAINITSELNSSIIIDLEESYFFLRGDWVNEHQWQSICDLDKLPNFTDMINALTHNGKEWKKWCFSVTPESDALPGEWDQKYDSLKPDRILLAAQAFVNSTLCSFDTQPPLTSYDSIYNDTNKNKPVIFVLPPGVDPYHQLEQLAKSKDSTLVPVSLGQGQAQKAIGKLYEGRKAGLWVYLANFHLSLSLNRIRKIYGNIETILCYQ